MEKYLATMEDEIKLEQEYKVMAENLLRASYEQAVQNGTAGTTKLGNRLIEEVFDDVNNNIKTLFVWKKSKRGALPTYAPSANLMLDLFKGREEDMYMIVTMTTMNVLVSRLLQETHSRSVSSIENSLAQELMHELKCDWFLSSVNSKRGTALDISLKKRSAGHYKKAFMLNLYRTPQTAEEKELMATWPIRSHKEMTVLAAACIEQAVKGSGFFEYGYEEQGTGKNRKTLKAVEWLEETWRANVEVMAHASYRYPPLEECEDHYQDTLAPFIYDKLKANPALAGQPTDPQRFDELEITKRELSYGKAGFALQFMLNTRLSDAEKYPLKVADLIVTPLDLYETSVKWAWANGRDQLIKDIPCTALTGDFFYSELSRSAETLPYDYTVMSIDPSGRGKDETSYAVLKYLNGYLFLMDVGGFKEGYSDIVLTQLANRAKFWNVDLIVPEDNYGDGMFTKLMTPVFTKIHPCGIEPVKNRGQKELRIIDTLEPVMMRHKLIVNRPVIEADYKVFQQDYNYSLIYQMTRLCRDKGALAHDDRLEAVAIGVAHFLENMDINESEKITEISEEELDRWMNVSVLDKYAKDDTRYARLERLKR